MHRLALLAFVLALGSCKPSVGSSCEKGEARCEGKQSQLICSGGKLISAPCRGPKGCQTTPTGIACDVSANKPGDPCSLDEESTALCADRKQMLSCSKGSYQLSPCRGPTGCTTHDGRALCDSTIATAGDACKDVTKACSADGKQVLTCQDGKMAASFFCLGPGACKASAGKLDCDLTIARDEDPCTKEMEGKVACNIDQLSIVACRGGKFVIDEKCEKPKRCSTEGGSIRCAKAE